MENAVNKYFDVTIKSHRMTEEGMPKQMTDQFVARAVNFTDAEATILSFCEQNGMNLPEIKKLAPASYSNVMPMDEQDDEARWYKAKISILIEQDNGQVKRSAETMLIEAPTFDEALKILNDVIRKIPSDVETATIQETKFQGVITN